MVLMHGLKMAESSINPNHWKYNQNDFYWAFTPAKVFIYQSIHSSDLGGILAHVQIFAPFKQD